MTTSLRFIWGGLCLVLLLPLVTLLFLGSRAAYAQARPLVIAGATVIPGTDSAPRALELGCSAGHDAQPEDRGFIQLMFGRPEEK